MNTATEHILQCNQSEPLANASGRIVDLMNEVLAMFLSLPQCPNFYMLYIPRRGQF